LQSPDSQTRIIVDLPSILFYDPLSMPDLLTNPLWQPADLGTPVPGSPHSVSACLPTWADNVGYEEGDPRVCERLMTGYPRFVYNRLCSDLFAECATRFAGKDETCLVFPTRAAGERFAVWLKKRIGCETSIYDIGRHAAHAVCFPKTFAQEAKDAWQHTGEGISSRQAEACLTDATADDGGEAKRLIREKLAGLHGVSLGDVFLFSCGMSAVAALHRVLGEMFSNRKSVQFGFPYVDTLKVQEKFGPGAHFFPKGDDDDLSQLSRLLDAEPVAGLYTEFPSNPLLSSPDLARLAELSRSHGIPLIVDDTLATVLNADLRSVADVLFTSLTKHFSGMGDVTGGSVVVNPESPFHDQVVAVLEGERDALLWGADAIVLERNSRDFEQRVPRIDATAARLAASLDKRPEVAEVFHPSCRSTAMYDAFRRENGGYGGLLSIVLQNPSQTSSKFYDALRITKGPNLGMNYSLACPFTILAHYNELDFAERCGVSRWLIRISVGLEDADDLIGRFDEALSDV
jgi:cystathionine gamma-synthase